jgi:hypothetical protein
LERSLLELVRMESILKIVRTPSMADRRRRKKRKDQVNRKAAGRRSREVLEDSRARGGAAKIAEGPQIPAWIFEGLEQPVADSIRTERVFG